MLWLRYFVTQHFELAVRWPHVNWHGPYIRKWQNQVYTRCKVLEPRERDCTECGETVIPSSIASWILLGGKRTRYVHPECYAKWIKHNPDIYHRIFGTKKAK